MTQKALPIVSVIMPAYNVEAYIEKAIQSVLNQTYADFELIISDDGSQDSTVSIIDSFSDTRIVRILHRHNIGYAENMNALFKAAKGKFIIIQDADDYCTPDRIEVLANFLTTQEEIDMVGSGYIKVNERNEEERFSMPLGREEIRDAFVNMMDPLPVLNGTVMFRRKIIDQNLFFRKLKYVNRGQDDDWLFRVSEQFNIANVEEYLYYYRWNASSMTQRPSSYNYYSIFSGTYVRFLKSYRTLHGIDALDQGNWQEIENFFKKEKKKIVDKEPAFLELYIAHKYLGLNNRIQALQWFLKSIVKDPFNSYSWKKIIHILLYR